MRRRNVRYRAQRFLCLALSMILTAANPAVMSFAAQTESAEENASLVQLTCETENLELASNDRSLELHLCLTQEDELIRQKILREDVVLGGVFGDMVVSGVRNDNKTILLDLSGVPDLSGDDQDAPLQGTMEFPGFLFGCDDSVEASVSITRKSGAQSAAKPSFHPYFDGMRVDRKDAELHILLIPVLGEFSEDFNEDDIYFGRELKDAKIRFFQEAGNGCYELIAVAPKEEQKEAEEGYSVFGSIILSEGSMVSPEGEVYDKKLYDVREYSAETTGRDLNRDDVNSLKTDVRSIKDFVDLFGDTTFGTVLKTTGGGLSAVSAGYSILSLVGLLPSSSGNAAILAELQNIQSTLNKVDEKCDYMTGVLDEHTRMIRSMGVKIDEQYLGGFDAAFAAMVEKMDVLEEEIQNPYVKSQIEQTVERVAEKYQIPQPGAGREIDEESIVPDEEYLEYDYAEYEEENVEETLAYDDLIASGSLFEDEDAEADTADAPDAEADEEQQTEEAQEEETETEVPEEAAEEETQGEDAVDAQAQEEDGDAEVQAQEEETVSGTTVEAETEAKAESEAVAETEAKAESEAGAESEAKTEKTADEAEEDTVVAEETDPAETTEETEETEKTEETEAAAEGRVLDADETLQYLMELDYEVGRIHLTASMTIAGMLNQIWLDYSSLSKRFDTNNSSNPITAFCNAHEGTDNFATSSLAEKELYKQYVRYELSRALTILSAMDSPTAYRKAIEKLQKKDEQNTWPDVEKDTKDRYGNPYCYLMENYVRLATVNDIKAWWGPLQDPDAKNSYKDAVQCTSKAGLNVSATEFFTRMHGRTLLQELRLAEITNLDSVQKETWTNPDNSRKNFGGITFRYERWGVKNGFRTFEWNSTHAWTDGMRYSDPYSTSLGGYDGINYGGQLLSHNKSYVIAATQYIRWSNGPGDYPAESLLYQGNDKSTYIYYPMTTLVKA